MRQCGLLLLALLGAGPLLAQDAIPWRTSYFPYLLGNASTGLLAVGHLHVARQAEYGARVPFDGILALDGGASARGSRFLAASFRAPGLMPGWRFAADAEAVREATFGYYGLGQGGADSAFDPDSDFEDAFFRVRRTRYAFRGEVTRRLRGPVHLAVAASVAHTRFSAEDGTLFATQYGDAPLASTDVTGRVSLVVDTRNYELIPTRGVLFEAGLYGGSGRFESRNLAQTFGPADELLSGYVSSYSPKGYAGAYAHFRGYVSPREGTVLAARIAARALGSHAPLAAQYLLPQWEHEVSVLGGPESHRSFVSGRFAGRGMLLASAEVRHNLLDVGDYGAVTLIGFVDAGRAFGGDDLQWSLHGWKVGGGGGVALRVLRSAMLLANFAGGPDGFVFSMGTGWAF